MEGINANTVSVDGVEWIMLQHWPEPPKNVTRRFKLVTNTHSHIIQSPLAPNCEALKTAFGNVRVTEIPVNFKITTTGHKLQEILTKDLLIVESCDYGFANWVYVIISRVCTIAGLFLCKPLDNE